MNKPLRAVCGFRYPDGDKSLAAAKAGKLNKVKWVQVAAGTLLDEPSAELLKSWLANECVEWVKT